MAYRIHQLEKELKEEKRINYEMSQSLRLRYDEAERMCRILTDIADDIKSLNPEIYRKVIVPVFQPDDPRPDWFLDEEYAFRIV